MRTLCVVWIQNIYQRKT